MAASAICFGLFVILVIILGTENEVNATPVPDPIPAPDICIYRHRHGKNHEPTTSTAMPPADKAKDLRKEKLKTFGKLLEEILDMDKDADKKKKDEAEKKKKEEEAAKKKKEEAKGFGNIGDIWNTYWQFVTSVYNYSLEN